MLEKRPTDFRLNILEIDESKPEFPHVLGAIKASQPATIIQGEFASVRINDASLCRSVATFGLQTCVSAVLVAKNAPRDILLEYRILILL
jgi:hypothetical protein